MLALVVFGYLLYLFLRKDKSSSNRQPQTKRINIGPKKTSSLLSVKQYESHSNSDSSSEMLGRDIKTR